jgi:hypothetical protein
MTRLELAGVLALALAAAACSPKNNGTLLVAHVDTDLSVPSALNSIEISLAPQHGGGTTDSFPITSRASLPVTLAIRPSGDPAFTVDVTATGRLGGTSVVTQTATLSFSPGEAREFTLFLAQDCARPMPCTNASSVCIKGGTCVAKTMVTQTTPYPPVTDGGMDGPKEVGGFDAGGRDARPNPGQWVVASPAFLVTTAALNGVWPISDADVWVVGSSASRGFASHLANGQWTEAMLPNNAPTLFGVWASGGGDVWAVGALGTVLRYDGNVWSAVSISGMAPMQNLSAVWGASSSDVWIVGQAGVILHGGATGVTRETSNTTDNLVSVWGTGNSDVWAVTALGTVVHRDATGWSVQATSLAAHIFYGIWPASRTDVWTVGAAVTLHNDGSGWTGTSNPLDPAISIWGSASDDVWAVGGTPTGSTFISRFNGVQWVSVPSPGPTPLQAVRGLSATNVWAVGGTGTVLRLQVP